MISNDDNGGHPVTKPATAAARAAGRFSGLWGEAPRGAPHAARPRQTRVSQERTSRDT